VWALWYLQREGAVQLSLDPVAAITRVEQAYFDTPDTSPPIASLFSGSAGVLLVAWRLTGSSAVADRLYSAVQSNIANPSNEAFLGASGTALAAWCMWEATQEARWREVFRESQENVWATWKLDAASGCHLWTQSLYGTTVQYLGAAHGLAGNITPLLIGDTVDGAGRYAATLERTVAVLEKFADDELDAVNWPPGTYKPRPDGPSRLLQWCHGAPGFVTALARAKPGDSSKLDALLVKAGEATWRAGPPRKGAGICHGTAGNGHAFLTLFERTRDARWLERARAFAMHAITQSERERAIHGGGRCSLWTGDAGVAVFLWQCITVRAGLPVLDFLS
jgi:lantibiotic modifying enzyme